MGLFSFFRRKPPESLRKGFPDPAFMGEFLVHSFVDSHFGLSKADLDDLTAPLPDAIRDPARYWTVVYLCWVYRMKLRERYGDGFFQTAFQTARARFAVTEATTVFGDNLSFWFEQLDHAAANLGQSVKGVEIPMEYFAALAFLALSPDSPFFRQTEFPDSIDFDFAAVLEKARQSTLRLIEVAGDIGGPLKDSQAESPDLG